MTLECVGRQQFEGMISDHDADLRGSVQLWACPKSERAQALTAAVESLSES